MVRGGLSRTLIPVVELRQVAVESDSARRADSTLPAIVYRQPSVCGLPESVAYLKMSANLLWYQRDQSEFRLS